MCNFAGTRWQCPVSRHFYEFPRGKRGTIATRACQSPHLHRPKLGGFAPAVRLTAPGSVCASFSTGNKGPGDTCNHGSGGAHQVLALAARSRLDNHSGDNDAAPIGAQYSGDALANDEARGSFATSPETRPGDGHARLLVFLGQWLSLSAKRLA